MFEFLHPEFWEKLSDSTFLSFYFYIFDLENWKYLISYYTRFRIFTEFKYKYFVLHVSSYADFILKILFRFQERERKKNQTIEFFCAFHLRYVSCVYFWFKLIPANFTFIDFGNFGIWLMVYFILRVCVCFFFFLSLLNALSSSSKISLVIGKKRWVLLVWVWIWIGIFLPIFQYNDVKNDERFVWASFIMHKTFSSRLFEFKYVQCVSMCACVCLYMFVCHYQTTCMSV